MYWCPLLNKSFIVHKQCSEAWTVSVFSFDTALCIAGVFSNKLPICFFCNRYVLPLTQILLVWASITVWCECFHMVQCIPLKWTSECTTDVWCCMCTGYIDVQQVIILIAFTVSSILIPYVTKFSLTISQILQMECFCKNYDCEHFCSYSIHTCYAILLHVIKCK